MSQPVAPQPVPPARKSAGTVIAAAVVALIATLFAAILVFAAAYAMSIEFDRPRVSSFVLLFAILLGLFSLGQLVAYLSGAIALFRRRPVGRVLVLTGAGCAFLWLVSFFAGTVVTSGDLGFGFIMAYAVGLPAIAITILALLPPTGAALRKPQAMPVAPGQYGSA